jgi:hypothetical protein
LKPLASEAEILAAKRPSLRVNVENLRLNSTSKHVAHAQTARRMPSTVIPAFSLALQLNLISCNKNFDERS